MKITKEIIAKFDEVVARGFSNGIGDQDGQMCVEAAICYALDLPHRDDPGCVSKAVRDFKIRLNDNNWSSPAARAAGLRDLGIAQLGSLGVVDDVEFSRRLAEKTIRVLIPMLFREVFPGNEACLKAADRCEAEGSRDAARAARVAAWAARDAAWAARDAAWAALAARDAGDAARVATRAADAAAWAAGAWAAHATTGDKYLKLSAQLALEVLKELKSPGCEWV